MTREALQPGPWVAAGPWGLGVGKAEVMRCVWQCLRQMWGDPQQLGQVSTQVEPKAKGRG